MTHIKLHVTSVATPAPSLQMYGSTIDILDLTRRWFDEHRLTIHIGVAVVGAWHRCKRHALRQSGALDHFTIDRMIDRNRLLPQTNPSQIDRCLNVRTIVVSVLVALLWPRRSWCNPHKESGAADEEAQKHNEISNADSHAS
jgi:hypothetical protein